MSDKLPETIYVYWDGDAEIFWLCAEETLIACAERDKNKLVGVYYLRELLDVSLKITSKVVSKKVEGG